MRRKIAVVTTSRADYGHLYWPIRDLASHPDVALTVIALGPHLSPEFGHTAGEIERDALPIDERIECLLSSDTDIGMAKTIGVATLGLADTLGRLRPDLLLVIADRFEMLAPASTALALRIPLVHIEGGEISEGAIDDAVRNALTKLSHVHLTTTEQARRRVLAMGEEAWRVHRVGAPSLDHLKRSRLLAQADLEALLSLDLSTPPVLVGFHPLTIARDSLREAPALFGALAQLDVPLVFCYPNADAGSRELIRQTQAFCADHPRARVIVNLGHVAYWSLLRCASAVVGNSSSGIMETPSLGVPAVNVGLRQKGRERAANIVDVVPETGEILAALTRVLSPGFRDSLGKVINPYGDGHASERIVRILTTVALGEELRVKRPVPLDDGRCYAEASS